MSNYVQNTNFATKDALPSGDSLKIVRGTEINTEFNNIATAVATKADTNSPTLATPTLVNPALGTPASGNLANCTFPTLNQSTTGNAATATRLQNARTIGGVSFNGTANINLPGVNQAGNQNTTGNAATATNASTATALQTARTIGGVSFNGTANINLPGVNQPGNQNVTGNVTGNINGTVGATTAFTGAFTNLTASGTLGVTGAGTIQGLTVGRGAGAIATNTAMGSGALSSNTTGSDNTGSGTFALFSNTTGTGNTANGRSALFNNTTGSSNTAGGISALESNTTGGFNTATGRDALRANTTGSFNTAFGEGALSLGNSFFNANGFGSLSQVTANNQVQLGNASTTTFVYGTVQNRSDLRDKADVRDTTLGLSFINALRPVDYKWDMRDDYRPERPADLPADYTPEQEAAHKAEIAAWLEAVKQDNLVRDGSKKRNRYHHGLIAQEVKAVLEQQNIDFGGYQDHKISGGHDVLSIGYDELIGPLIKAVQELKAEFDAYKLAHP